MCVYKCIYMHIQQYFLHFCNNGHTYIICVSKMPNRNGTSELYRMCKHRSLLCRFQTHFVTLALLGESGRRGLFSW